MKKYFVSLVFLFVLNDSFSQQLPVGACGIVYIHDAAGNRTRRVYFCNNGIDPYPLRTTRPEYVNKPKEEVLFSEKEVASMEVVEVEAIYPNPTSGIFNLAFSKALKSADISIIDMNGRTMQQFRASGISITCNIGSLAAGTYFIRIREDDQVIAKKIIKQ